MPATSAVPATPAEIAERVRAIVAGGSPASFAELFAPDGVLAYPFAPPGHPRELTGPEAIRAYFDQRAEAGRALLQIEGTEQVIRRTDDPEVVVTEITHYGQATAIGQPYRFTALGVVRVRDGRIVRYDDYMDSVAMFRMLGRTDLLIEALRTAS